MINNEEVEKIAFLSRLRVENADAAVTEFNKILSWIEQLKEVDTKGVEPLVSTNEEYLDLRADEVSEGGNAEAVLANAPVKEYGYFVVPKVVE